MTKTSEANSASRKPDGILTTQTDKQIIITEIFFNPDSKETFEEKLIKAVLADNPM